MFVKQRRALRSPELGLAINSTHTKIFIYVTNFKQMYVDMNMSNAEVISACSIDAQYQQFYCKANIEQILLFTEY